MMTLHFPNYFLWNESRSSRRPPTKFEQLAATKIQSFARGHIARVIKAEAEIGRLEEEMALLNRQLRQAQEPGLVN